MENIDLSDNTQKKEENDVKDVLVIASKIKSYIRTKSGMNTSNSIVEAISEKVKILCDSAIENAKHDGRKTVMDRDIR